MRRFVHKFILTGLTIVFIFLQQACKKDETKPITGSFTDPRDGQVYPTVEIGEQIWFSKNLNYVTYSAICYDEEQQNCDIYGRLYDWESANALCPEGWHLPSDLEWKELEAYLGMNQDELDAAWWRGTDQGAMLKESNGWADHNGTNSTGFSALPGGNFHSDLYNYKEMGGYFWTATQADSNNMWYRSLASIGHQINRGIVYKEAGYSVRCLKD